MTLDSSGSSHQDQTATVIGGGIAGLSAALLLSRSGCKVDLYERDQQLGGLLAPIMHDGLPLDRGSHRVHPEAHPLLVELTRDAQWQFKDRCGQLVLNGRHLNYPLDPLSFLRGLGLKTTLSMGLGWLTRPQALKRTFRWESDRREMTEDEGFETFVVRRVGRAAYSQFYEPYARKVWGIDPNDLSQTVAKQRVSTSNPASSILRKTERRFLYPEKGMGSLIDHLHEQLDKEGVALRTGTPLLGNAIPDGPIFHTGHLHDLVIDSTLDHRGLYLLHVTVADTQLKATDTWYTPETRYWFGRVSQPALFSPQLCNPNERILCIEIPEGKWGTQRNFCADIETVMEQLFEAGITLKRTEAIKVQQTFIPRVYPMYVRGWFHEQRRVLKAVAEQGPIFPCGRQGLFLHCNMDQAVATSAAAVEHWLGGGNSLEWAKHCETFADFRVRD